MTWRTRQSRHENSPRVERGRVEVIDIPVRTVNALCTFRYELGGVRR